MAHDRERLAAILGEIRSFLADRADAGWAARYARYFKEGYDPYGIPADVWEAQKARWSAAYVGELGLAGLLDLGDLLLASGKYEEGSLAVYLVGRCREQLDRPAYQRLGAWLEGGVRNWAHCDLLCGDLLSFCLRDGRVPLAGMAAWRESPFKFKRRAVPVAMLGLLKAQPDTVSLAAFLRPLMLDRERAVQQGLGWFLREAWKVSPRPVEEFLREWKDSAPRLIFQYATEKMTPEGKERFRRR